MPNQIPMNDINEDSATTGGNNLSVNHEKIGVRDRLYSMQSDFSN